jgi:hypothetical protein
MGGRYVRPRRQSRGASQLGTQNALVVVRFRCVGAVEPGDSGGRAAVVAVIERGVERAQRSRGQEDRE